MSQTELCAMERLREMLDELHKYDLASHLDIFVGAGYRSLQDLARITDEQADDLRDALVEKKADSRKSRNFLKAFRSRVNQPNEKYLHFYGLAAKINCTDVSGLDESTVLRVDIDPLNEHHDKIHVPPRVLCRLTQTSTTNPMPVVSLLGPTGAGKSFIASSFLLRDGVLPLVASPDQHIPTSAHVCVHRAAIHSGSAKARPILLFDSEGEDGRAPKTLLETGMRKLNILRMMGMTEDALQQQMEASIARRQDVIKERLPPMAYLLSDVVVFIDTVEPRRTERVNRIKQFANQAHEAASSLSWKPSLILVQNKWLKETDSAAFNVTHELELEWLVKDLSLVFSSVVVLRIAHRTQHHVFEASLNELHEELLRMVNKVYNFRQEHGLLFSEREFWLNFRPFVVQAGSPGQLCMSLEHLVSRNLASATAADNALRAFDMLQAGRPSTGPEGFHKMVGQLLRWYAYSYAGEVRRDGIDQETWKKTLRATYDSVVQVLKGNEPCSATVCHNEEIYSCTQLCKGHENKHRNPVFVRVQSENLVKRFFSFGLWKDWIPCVWTGEFQPSPLMASHEDLEKDFEEFLSQDVEAYLRKFPAKKSVQDHSEHSEQCDICWLCLRKVSEQINLQNRHCRHLLCRPCLMTRMMLLGRENKVVCPFCDCESDGHAHSSQDNDKGFRILSLDGGGVRGLIEILILKHLEQVFAPLQITSLFDLIIGTSAGGLISMALLNGISLSDLEGKIQHLAEDFFSIGSFSKFWSAVTGVPWCDSSAYQSVVKMFFGPAKMDKFRADRPPYVFCVAFDVQAKERVILGNYPRDFKDTKLVKQWSVSPSYAALSTTAAPIFFDPVDIEMPQKDGTVQRTKFVDGGVTANCPAALGVKVATELQSAAKGFDDIFVESIASIGTGLSEPSVAVTDMNGLSWAGELIDIATNSELQWKEQIENVSALQCRPQVRVNPPRLGSLDAFSSDSIPKLQKGMQDYFNSDLGKQQIGKLIHMTYAKLWEVKQDASRLTPEGPGVNFRIEMQDSRCDFNGMQEQELRNIILKRGRGLEEKDLQNLGKEQLCNMAKEEFDRKPFLFDFQGKFGYRFAGVEHELDDGQMQFNLEHRKSGAPELDVFWRSLHGDISLSGLPRLVRVME